MSKTEARLQLHDPPGKGPLGLTEERIARRSVQADDIAVEWIAAVVQIYKVGFIEDVEQIGAELESGVFPENGQSRQTEGFL